MKNCYIYLRVSTDEQAREGFSIDNQKRACGEFAQNNGYQIKRLFVEDGRSAKTTDRPVFQEMMQEVREDPVDAIIVLKIDRIARNVGDFANIRKELKTLGTRLMV